MSIFTSDHTSGAADTAVTIIVPTFNEAENVEPLVEELRACLDDERGYEILFVDDSSDATPATVLAMAERPGVPVRLLHRPPGERDGGLGGAVVAGVRDTDAPIVVVMDGDLQHPPTTVPQLVAALEGHDVAVASRYVGGGKADGLSGAVRHAVSLGSTHLAKALFPRRLRHCTDPMTGFFALRTASIRAGELEPMGFKILLEILARNSLRVAEVPFTFAERHAGESKASLKQGLTFGWQLLNLRIGQAGRFAVVGATGIVVNLVFMALMLGAGMNYLLASVLATEVAIASNFALQERFVFADRAGREGRTRRLVTSVVVNSLEAVVRLPLLALAVAVVGLHELSAQALVIALAFVFRFWFTSRVIYRPVSRRGTVAATLAPSAAPGADPTTPRPTPVRTPPMPPTLRSVPSGVDWAPPARGAHLDIVVPALNEELRLGATLEAISDAVQDAPFTSRIIVVDNGSVDGTADVIDLIPSTSRIDLISCARRGKGAAVRTGVLYSDARYVAYCDADLSTPPSMLLAGMALLIDGHDVVIGSRHTPESEIQQQQSLVRRAGGRVFNRAARSLVGPISDTQCGFKMIDGDLARDVFDEMRLAGYAFDVELIARLQRRGSTVAELPVTWSDDDGTRLRMATDGYRAFRDLLTVRRALAGQGADRG